MKRYLSLLLALLLALALLPALAESSVDESEHVTIRVITASHTLTRDLNEIPVWNELQEKHNITIEWDQVSSGFSEKKAVILASPEDMPDLWISGISDSDLTMNYGAFLDMTDLINEYAPNIKKMFEEEPDTLGLSTFSDGGIYALPQVRPFRPDSYTVMMINKDWLDVVGMDIPTTLDELEQVLIAFRDNDCNGNGDPSDEIPLDWNAGRGSIFPITALCGAWGMVEDYTSAMVTVNDGVVDFLWATEPFYNLEIYLNRLWNENLINVEVFTQDYSGMMAKSRQGESAMVGVTLGWSISDRTGQYADQYVVLDALKASADSEINPTWPTSPARVVMDTNKASISASCEHPDRVIALLDDIYSEYYSIQMYYGSIPEFVEYDEATDHYTIKEPVDTTLDVQMWTNALVDNAPLYFPKDMYEKTTAPSEIFDRIAQDEYYHDNVPAEIYPIVKFDEETTEELVFLTTDIYKLVDEKYASWIVNGGIEAEWDDYLNQLENMGLSQMREYYQKAYDEYPR